MTVEAPQLSKEEQELFDSMAKGDAAQKAAPEEKPAAKAEEKPAPEAKIEDKPKPEEKPQQTMIPKAALDEARTQNKELRAELKALKDLIADGDKKLEQLAKKAEAPAPKFEDDPAGNLRHENEKLQKSLEEIRTRLEKQDQAAATNGKVSEHKAIVDAKEAAFAKGNPDYWKASDHLAEVWRDEFLEAGFEAAEVPKLVFAKALGITHKAIQAGKDPAETVYKLAKRVGYAAPKAEEKKAEEKKPDGESKLKAIEKGQELAKGAGGGAGPDDTSIASLAQMDNEQLDRLVADKDWWAKNIKRSPLH